MVSPKFGAVLGPWAGTELYVNAGMTIALGLSCDRYGPGAAISDNIGRSGYRELTLRWRWRGRDFGRSLRIAPGDSYGDQCEQRQ